MSFCCLFVCFFVASGRTGGANAERLYKVKSRLEHIEQSNKVTGRQAGEVQMNDLGVYS